MSKFLFICLISVGSLAYGDPSVNITKPGPESAASECFQLSNSIKAITSCNDMFKAFQKHFDQCQGVAWRPTIERTERFEETVFSVGECYVKEGNAERAKSVLQSALDYDDFAVDETTHTNSFHNLVQTRLEAVGYSLPKMCVSKEQFAQRVKDFVANGDISPLVALTFLPFNGGQNHYYAMPFAKAEAFIKRGTQDASLEIVDSDDRCTWVKGWKHQPKSEMGFCYHYQLAKDTGCAYWSSFAKRN